MNDQDYEVAFGLIAFAGDSRSEAMLAITAAREGDFAQAARHLLQAEEKMHDAHGMQFKLIQEESQGNPVKVNIILVHAQDHLAMAISALEQAHEMIKLYEIIHKLIADHESGTVEVDSSISLDPRGSE